MNYVLQSLLAGLFTWGLTIIGSLTVFSIKPTSKKLISIFLGLGGGIMLAASMFSLIMPAIEYANILNYIPWLVCLVGFSLGVLMIVVIDVWLDKKTSQKLNISDDMLDEEAKKLKTKKNNLLLVLAIAIHNIPEGLAVGVAFGSVALGLDSVTIASAYVLALGIGLQNFPEGAAISIPLAATGTKKSKAFLYGALSAIVEPIFAVLGTVLVIASKIILPFMLLIAAAVMIYVVADEIIPTARKYTKKGTTIGVMLGFIIMMLLDLMFS